MPAETLTLSCVGDIYAAPATVAAFWADRAPLQHARELLARADVRFANLEAPLLESGTPLYSTGVRLRSPFATSALLAHLGFEVVTLANNHLFDYGPAGVRSTLARLDAEGIRHVGAGLDLDEARRPAFLDVRGRRLAFLGACDDQGGGAGPGPGVCLLDPRQLIPAVRRARKQANHVVVGVHTGIEFVECPEPWFLDLGKRLIDAGADVVVGHHPHVPQGILRHGRGLIACSLGDFLFDLPRGDDDYSGRARSFNLLHPILEVELAEDGVRDFRVHLLTRTHGVYADAAPAEGFDPAAEFQSLCDLLGDERRFREMSRAVYRAESYETLYSIYAALYLAARRGEYHRLPPLAWWLPTLLREPRRRFLRNGAMAWLRRRA